VTGVGEATGVDAVVEGRGDSAIQNDATERDVARVNALGEGNEVGRDVVLLKREPRTSAPEAGHDLVGDVDNAVTVTEFTHAT